MKVRLLSMFAVVALVAACASDPGAGGAGGAHGGQSAQDAANSAATAAIKEYAKSDRVFFDYDKSDVKADAAATVGLWAAWLKTNPATIVTVEGHCDERGTREYNLGLGERRASAVKDALVAAGVSANRVNTVSYGKEKPANAGHDDSAWAENRRGVILVTGGAS